MLAIINVTWRTPPLAARRSNSVGRRVGGFGQHRHPDQPVGGGSAELHQPVVVDAVAGNPQCRVVGRDLEDRTKDDLALHPVAIHVGQAQFGNRRAARALVVNPAAVEGVI